MESLIAFEILFRFCFREECNGASNLKPSHPTGVQDRHEHHGRHDSQLSLALVFGPSTIGMEGFTLLC